MVQIKHWLLTLLLIVNISSINAHQDLPDGFTDELYSNELVGPAGAYFVDTNFLYVWTREGTLRSFTDGELDPKVILDINEEVGSYGDMGLLGFAPHPNFKQNGLIYIAYNVDPYYLRNYGSESYTSVGTLDKFESSIARITRYQVDTSDFKTIVPNSRTVLLGQEITNSPPVAAPSHGSGGIIFGSDTTLLASFGDGNTWVQYHTGGDDYKKYGYDSTAKADGIFKPYEDVGSYRAQLLESYAGKVIRIDPMSGLGVPSNPFYDPAQPDSVISKVWSLGFRNPWRMVLQPGTGSSDPSDGNPGNILIGEVGYNRYEELDLVTGPGQNFGWPTYEGMKKQTGFTSQNVAHPYYTNPLSGTNGCPTDLLFDDLLSQPSENHSGQWPNPCNGAASLDNINVQTFIHQRPTLAWANEANNTTETHLPIFDEQGTAAYVNIDATASPVPSEAIYGVASVVGDFYSGDRWPEAYENAYFHGDFYGWIHAFFLDKNDGQLTDVIHFNHNAGKVVSIDFNPFDQALYYIVLDYSGDNPRQEIRRIRYGGITNPKAEIVQDKNFGTGSVLVNFDGSTSRLGQGNQLEYTWIMDGDSTESGQNVSIDFQPISASPHNRVVQLVVTDTAGITDTATTFVSINNTPPSVEITSLNDGDFYTVSDGPMQIDLAASVADAEHSNPELTYKWELILNHNYHSHLEATDTNRVTSIAAFALADDEFDFYSYTIRLTVTDPLGLSTTQAISIYPDASSSISIDTMNTSKEKWTIYPNPASNKVYLSSSKSIDGLRFQVSDVTGKTLPLLAHVNDWDGAGTYLDVSSLSSGTYMLAVVDQQGAVVHTGPVIIQQR